LSGTSHDKLSAQSCTETSGGAQSLAPSASKLSFTNKLLYGFGSVAFGIKDNGFSYLLLIFYNQVVGLPATTVAMALLIALLFDAAIDPFIGQVSDHLHTRWGRRHPLMYAAAIPAAISYLALWHPPAWDHQSLFIYLVVAAIVIRGFMSLYEVPSLALAAELSSGYDERSDLLSYRLFFGWVGGLTLNLIAFTIFSTLDRPATTLLPARPGQLDPSGYALYGLIAACAIVVTILVSTYGTHSLIPRLMAPPAKRSLTLRQTFAEMGETLGNRSFIFLMMSSVCTAMATGLAASLSNYFNTFFWQFRAGQIMYIPLGYYISATVALMAGPRLSRRFGKRPTAMTCLLLAVTFFVTPILLRLAGLMPANHTQALFSTIWFTSSTATTFTIIAATMGSSMIADVADAASLKTGRRSEGLFFAAWAFIQKSVSGLGILGAGLLIDFVGLKARMNPSLVSADVIHTFASVYAPVIIGLYMGSVLLLRGYAITRTSHEETISRLRSKSN